MFIHCFSAKNHITIGSWSFWIVLLGVPLIWWFSPLNDCISSLVLVTLKWNPPCSGSRWFSLFSVPIATFLVQQPSCVLICCVSKATELDPGNVKLHCEVLPQEPCTVEALPDGGVGVFWVGMMSSLAHRVLSLLQALGMQKQMEYPTISMLDSLFYSDSLILWFYSNFWRMPIVRWGFEGFPKLPKRRRWPVALDGSFLFQKLAVAPPCAINYIINYIWHIYLTLLVILISRSNFSHWFFVYPPCLLVHPSSTCFPEAFALREHVLHMAFPAFMSFDARSPLPVEYCIEVGGLFSKCKGRGLGEINMKMQHELS